MKDLERVCDTHEPVICCMSFFTTQLRHTSRIVSSIRSRFDQRVRLVAGGPHATGSPEGTLKMGFDVVVTGEGELVFPMVVEKLSGITNGLNGLDGNWPVVVGEPLDDLDRFPPVSLKHKLYPPIEITRGCLFRCRYCSVPCGSGPVRHRSVESVTTTARKLLKLRTRWDFRFISPNSLGYGSYSREPNEKAVEKLLRSLRELEGGKRIYFSTFPSEARPDYVTRGMVDLISELADNKTVNIGAQSGSERILKYIRRRHDLNTVYRASNLILEGGLRPVIDFILGFPGETETDQLETLDVMKDLVQMGGEVRVHHFLPLAGSPMAGMKPSLIAQEVLTEIGRLTLRGSASGSFTEQMKLAREISEFSQ